MRPCVPVSAPNNGLTARPQFGKVDSAAVLRNLRYQGKSYTVTRKGIVPD